MTHAALLLGLAAAFCWGSSELVIAVLARRVGSFRTLLAMQAAGLVLLLVLLAVLGVPAAPTAGEWALLLGLGPVAVLTYLCFYRALELGPIAVVSPVVSGYGSLTLLLAVLVAGETLHAGQALGCALVLGAVVLAGYVPGGGERHGIAGILLAGVAMAGFAGYVFGMGTVADRLGWLLPILVSRAASLALLAVLRVVREPQRPLGAFGRAGLAWAALAGAVEAAGYLAFNRGAVLGSIAVTGAVSSAYPLCAIVAGLVHFREQVRPHQLVGVAGVLAGMVVLAVT